MRRLGVLGWPVRHSRSPRMQRAALRATGLEGELDYQHLPVPPQLFVETVRALPAAGYLGANVTIPHKEAALALADTASDAARAIGAANTLTFAQDGSGAVHADNTDAPGLLDVLPAGPGLRTALVLGAGGSARAAAYALREAGMQTFVRNRTHERAEQLAADLGVVAMRDVPDEVDLIVNCTSVGLHDPSFKELGLPADALDSPACVVDLVYRPGGTALLEAARAAGTATVDGLEVLVAQGARSFESWTGRRAPRDAMRDAARDRPPPHTPHDA